MCGAPCIRGYRFPVKSLLEYMACGMTPQQLMEDFSFLQQEDFKAALLYAAYRCKTPILR